MFDKSRPKLKSLSAAEAALSTYEKIEQAIGQAVADLEPLIHRRQAAERGLRDAEIAAAVGDDSGGVQKAEKELTSALKGLDSQAGRLRGLRGRLAACAPQLIAGHDALQSELPSHAAAVREEFAAEWRKAVEAFEVAVSRRSALENILGEPLALPAPVAGPCDLGAMGKPSELLAGLRAGIEQIASLGRTRPIVPPTPGVPVTPYDPQGVYILKRPASGLPAESLVVEASFGPGQLEHLVSAKWAVPARDPEEQRGEFEARRALRRLAQADTDTANQRGQAEAQAQAEERKRFLEKYYPQQSRRLGANPGGPAADVAAGRAAIEAEIDGA